MGRGLKGKGEEWRGEEKNVELNKIMKDCAWKKKDFKNGGQYSGESTPDSHMCNSLGKIEYREIRQGMDPLLIIDVEKATVVLYFLKEKVMMCRYRCVIRSEVRKLNAGKK